MTAVGGCLALFLGGPSLARALESKLVHVLVSGVSGSVTYQQIQPGTSGANGITGIVGKGTINGHLSLEARIAARVLGAVKGVPLSAIASGGTYVARFDADASGNYTGTVVIRFEHKIGSLCVNYTVTYGAYAGQGYVPSTEQFATAGGTGKVARVKASGHLTQGAVTGESIEQILAGGSFSSVKVAKKPVRMGAACSAVAKLATG